VLISLTRVNLLTH